jgi:hypothetical protein
VTAGLLTQQRGEDGVTLPTLTELLAELPQPPA